LKEGYNLIDRFLIYAFDYNNFSGDNCGPTAPLVSSKADQNSIDKTFNSYVSLGIKPENIVIVLGLYGQQWAMLKADPYNQTSKYTKSVSFFDFEEDYSIRIKPVLDNTVLQNYVSFSDQAGNWFITWADNVMSLSLKCDYVNNKNIKGIGFWELGNSISGDQNTQKFWPLIYKKFALPEANVPREISEDYSEIPNSNIDSILSVNQALIMSAVDLAENPFLPDRPDRSQLTKIKSFGYQYKEIIKAIGMFFTILTFCAVIALIIAMFDEKVRMLLFYDQAFLFLIPGIMLVITITLRLLGVIWNSEMEFIIGGLFGIACHYFLQTYMNKRSQIDDETP
jgi:ABC-type multidrug transport system permease subunit